LDEQKARLIAPNMDLELQLGTWSQILEFSFKINFLYSVRVITRAILTGIAPEVQLYFLPLQIHPLKSPWRYGTPPGFIKDSWKSSGPFLSLGWPQDTIGLEEGWIDDEQFLDLCEQINRERERVFHHHLKSFKEGIFAIVYDSLDRIQHMFWRDRPDVIMACYESIDALVGRAVSALPPSERSETRIVILSDHGFTDFNYKIHLNRWLIEQGYLVIKNHTGKGDFKDVDWSRSQAYALGLNSLYINLAGREGQGIVSPQDKEALVARMVTAFTDWKGPDGKRVINNAYTNADIFEGPHSQLGPDLLIGYASGYRGSQETGLGAWGETSAVQNRDHWGADHCIDAEVVPGVLFINQKLSGYPALSYKDIPSLTIGMELDNKGNLPPPRLPMDEDQKVLEERMKSLGYL
jgi:hypothetical protein